MIRVKNTSVGPRGLYAGGEMVMLQSGESRDLDVTAANLKIARETGWFSLEGEAKADPKQEEGSDSADLTKLTDDELRAHLKDAGVAADGRWGRDKLLTEARKLQG